MLHWSLLIQLAEYQEACPLLTASAWRLPWSCGSCCNVQKSHMASAPCRGIGECRQVVCPEQELVSTLCLYHSEFSKHLWRSHCRRSTGVQHGQTSEASKRTPSSGQSMEINHERQILTSAVVEGQQVQQEYREGKDLFHTDYGTVSMGTVRLERRVRL